MKEIGTGIKTIWKEDKNLIVMMILLFLMSLVLMIVSLVTLNPANSVTKIGYGDIGGYRDGAWHSMFVWPLTALVLGVLNNLVAVKIFQKNGAAVARLFIAVTMLFVVIAFVVLVRLLGES